MRKSKKSNTFIQLDILSIISISIIVFIVQNILHEFVGHGGATLLVGGKLISLTTSYLESNLDSASVLGRRIVAAAGPLVNILFGMLFWIILKWKNITNSSFKYFLWLFMTVNLLTGTGYFLFSGVAGIGDWINAISGFALIWMWRIIMIVTGIFLYLLVIFLSLKELNVFIGADSIRHKRALRLSLIPYLSGSIATTIGAFLNPVSFLFVFTSAASTFGGASGLAWMTQLYSTKLFPKIHNQPITIKRNWLWILVAISLLLVHVFLLGPGIKF